MRYAPLAGLVLLLSAVSAQSPRTHSGESPESARRLGWFAKHQEMARTSPHRGLRWQFVGPVTMKGRITDIDCHPSAPETIFVASASGGVFKSTDDGKTWRGVFDDQATASIGDIAIAPSNPKIVWVGTGEANILRSSMAGTGIYRSVDGGETFRYAGLGDTQHIARVVCHPTDPDTVFVASAGHEYNHDRSRGIYVTEDGGKSWRQIFHRGEDVGVIDLCIDPAKPEILYATTAERLRLRWNDPKPGPQSGIWQSVDGGKSWKRLTGGLPDFAKGEFERIGIDLCRAQPNTVYAALHKAAGDDIGAHVYRSDDRGASWRLVEGNDRVRRVFPQYGWFFGQVRVDPKDPEFVYVLGLTYARSNNGGKRWRTLRGTHADYHAMWINPNDPKHVLVGNDGGLMISRDRCRTYRSPDLPIAQCYNAGVSQAKGGFHIYCSVQDNGAWRGFVDLRAGRANITRPTWERAPGDESGRHAVDPENPNLVYSLRRYGGGPSRTEYPERAADEAPGRRPPRGRNVAPRFTKGRRRAQWVSPLIISPVHHERLLYGAQFVFLSEDRGDTWRQISDDLTNLDPERQGNIAHAVVFSLAESKVEKGVIYAGTDDGNIQVTRDEGKTWTLRNEGIPTGRCISSLEACHVTKGTVFATVNGKRHDDFGAYVFRSADYGETWQRISSNLPGGPANVIKQDPAHPDTLFLGTDRGVYISTDGGKHWDVLGEGLPTVYVHDLVVQTAEDFLVIATHGRGCFVLDIRSLRGKTR